MSHTLLRARVGGVTVFYCECGLQFGGIAQHLMDHCAGDILDAHREHAITKLVVSEGKVELTAFDPRTGPARRLVVVGEKVSIIFDEAYEEDPDESDPGPIGILTDEDP